MKRKWIVLLIAFLLTFSLACSLMGILEGVEKASEKAQEVASEAEEIAGEMNESEESSSNTEEGEENSGEDDIAPGDYDPNALDELNSYRMAMVFRFEDADGTTEEQTLEGSFTREPKASHTIMTGMMGGDEEGAIEIIQIGDEQWIKMGDEWIYSQTPAEEDDFSTLMDFDELNDEALSGAKDLGNEKVNGIRCRHYRVEDTAFLLGAVEMVGEMEEGQVDIWIANEKNLPPFAVRMEYEIRGKAEGEDTVESMYMTMDVTDINMDFTIEAPEGAEADGGVPEDIPLMADAKEKTVMAGVIFYETDSSFQAVKDFYANEMPSAGWNGPETIMSTDEMSMETWTKGDRAVQVSIVVDEDTGKVSVTITPGQ